MTSKDRLYQLVEQLPESAVAEAERLLERLQAANDPVLQAFLNAPIDDEPLTPEEIEAIEEGEAEFRRGAFSPWEEVRDRLFGSE